MSLDVYLTNGDEPVFEWNITHNVNKMAMDAGCYQALWRPDEEGITKASELVHLLEAGLLVLLSDPARFEAMNPENGWGSYDGLVTFVVEYLKACRKWPDATVEVSR